MQKASGIKKAVKVGKNISSIKRNRMIIENSRSLQSLDRRNILETKRFLESFIKSEDQKFKLMEIKLDYALDKLKNDKTSLSIGALATSLCFIYYFTFH